MAREQTYVVLLRAVNVGGSGRMTMAALREAVERAGYPDARTYVQTGNLVLRTSDGAARVASTVERAINEDLGVRTAAIVRTRAEMRAIAAAAPLADDAPSRLGVGFCKARPAAAAVQALTVRDFGADVAEVRGREVFLWHPHGMGRSKLSGAVLERVLGVPITVRNWKVTQELARLASA